MNNLFKRLGLLTLGVVLVIFISNAVRDSNIPEGDYQGIHWDGPSYKPEYDETKWNILFDQHSHTLHSDGVLTVEQNIQWHIAMGFNAMVISDHNTFDGIDEAMEIAREKYSDDIMIIPGVEWTNNRIHMNFLFPPTISGKELSKKIKMPNLQPSDEDIRKAIEITHEAGGMVTVNHIPWSYRTFGEDSISDRDLLLDWGVDYIEVINENEWDEESYQFTLETDMGRISGTDMHSPGTVYGWTLMNAKDFTAEAIFEELKHGRTELIYMPQGAPYPHVHEMVKNPAYTLFRPLIALGDYFTELTYPDIHMDELLILLGWIYIVFFICEGFRALGHLISRKE